MLPETTTVYTNVINSCVQFFISKFYSTYQLSFRKDFLLQRCHRRRRCRRLSTYLFYQAVTSVSSLRHSIIQYISLNFLICYCIINIKCNCVIISSFRIPSFRKVLCLETIIIIFFFIDSQK